MFVGSHRNNGTHGGTYQILLQFSLSTTPGSYSNIVICGDSSPPAAGPLSTPLLCSWRGPGSKFLLESFGLWLPSALKWRACWGAHEGRASPGLYRPMAWHDFRELDMEMKRGNGRWELVRKLWESAERGNKGSDWIGSCEFGGKDETAQKNREIWWQTRTPGQREKATAHWWQNASDLVCVTRPNVQGK